MHACEHFTPHAAREARLHFVHQERASFPQLSVAENLTIGRGFERNRLGRIRWRQVRRRARAVLSRYGIDAHPDDVLGSLGAATQTMIEIARVLQDQDADDVHGVIVLDEATASLPAPEARLLLDAVRRYADEGETILFVTHRLAEVLEIADVVTVLRDGRVVATADRATLTEDSIVELIVGRTIDKLYPDAHATSSGDAVLSVHGLTGGPVQDASFTVARGEIVGIAGLVGSGRSSLLRMLFGDLPPTAGGFEVAGAALRPSSPGDAMRAGIGYVPEDRGQSTFRELSLSDNLAAGSVGEYWHGGRLRHRAQRRDSEAIRGRYLIRSASVDVPLASLSGGNQQKAVLARWLRRDPRVLLLDEPTQGVDVGARAEIYGLVREAAERGAGVVVASSDFEELAGLCDRVVVMVNGRLVDEVSRGPALDADTLHQLAYAT